MIVYSILAGLAAAPKIVDCYFAALSVFALCKEKPAADKTANSRLAVLVAARNEATVIGHLLDSLREQDYPAVLYDIYVAPNHCTDQTAVVARARRARGWPKGGSNPKTPMTPGSRGATPSTLASKASCTTAPARPAGCRPNLRVLALLSPLLSCAKEAAGEHKPSPRTSNLRPSSRAQANKSGGYHRRFPMTKHL